MDKERRTQHRVQLGKDVHSRTMREPSRSPQVDADVRSLLPDSGKNNRHGHAAHEPHTAIAVMLHVDKEPRPKGARHLCVFPCLCAKSIHTHMLIVTFPEAGM